MANRIETIGIVGAGTMGNGIAQVSAVAGLKVVLIDVTDAALEKGIGALTSSLAKLVEKGKIEAAARDAALTRIETSTDYQRLSGVDLVVEAATENTELKIRILRQIESVVSGETLIASNTSSISITALAATLGKPERFVGMHFFNPVHMMPLVEVIRGEKSSDVAVATTVAYAKKMGKNPIVVNDCPGFLVNRVLFPYFGGFSKLLGFGVDFVRIDKIMEKFGWPMGPAYLSDVVGIDTGHHGRDVMAEGFPDRMAVEGKTAVDVMYDANRLGQKNGKGFYAYETDKRGKPKKVSDPQAYELLKSIVVEERELTDEDIINYMMIPLCLETVRCLEDGIVETAAEADMGLIYGIGFPPFRGGALRYIDSIGVAEFVALADKYADLGALYHPTAKLREMAKNGQKFFG